MQLISSENLCANQLEEAARSGRNVGTSVVSLFEGRVK